MEAISRSAERKQRVCYLCGQPERDGDPFNKDHVPPKCLFQTKGKEFKDGLITLPAHTSCNSGKQSDDEYLRFIVLAKASQSNSDAKYLWDEKLMAQIRRPEGRGFHSMIKADLKEYEVQTPAGLYVGKEHAIDIDGNRLSRILFKVCQGLFYKETNKILAGSTPYLVYPMIEGMQNFKKVGEAQGKFKTVCNGVFKYSWVHEDAVIENGYYWLTFYDIIDVMVCLGNRSELPKTPPRMRGVRAI